MSGYLGLRRSQHSMDGSPSAQILRSSPRRPANLTITPMSSSTSETDAMDQSPELASELDSPRSSTSLSRKVSGANGSAHSEPNNVDAVPENPPLRSKPRAANTSSSNLTGSTLSGIYLPEGYSASRDDPLTPFGSGAQTPLRGTSTDTRSRAIPYLTAQAFKEKAAIGKERQRERRKSMAQQKHGGRRRSISSQMMDTTVRTAVLLALGVAYGAAITILHDSGRVAPVPIQGINRWSWMYLASWGMTGILIGSLFPYLDEMLIQKWSLDADESDARSEKGSAVAEDDEPDTESGEQPNSDFAEWSDIVRSVGALVGIAFAIRKLSWQSTLQVSLTLALANPVIWYLMDRTRNGFILSSIFGIFGACALISINPDWIPAPATSPSGVQSLLWATNGTAPVNSENLHQARLKGLTSYESIGVATWISSVLFCSGIFFGNIGRRLRLSE
ncbi:MAG: hypothetical protein Q9159_007448 [Coniocarpon cinnabarinum]